MAAAAPATADKVANGLCTNCLRLGHNCEAQREYELCIFCEDNELCPVAKAQQKNGTLPAWAAPAGKLARPVDLPAINIEPLRANKQQRARATEHKANPEPWKNPAAPPVTKRRAANDYVRCQCEPDCKANTATGKPFAWGHGHRYQKRMDEKRRQELQELKSAQAEEIMAAKPKPMRGGPALPAVADNDWVHKGAKNWTQRGVKENFTEEIDLPIVRKTEVEVVQPKDRVKDAVLPAYELLENSDYEQRYAPKTAEYRLLQEVLPKMTVGQVVVIGCQASAMSKMGKRLLRAFEEYAAKYDTQCKGLEVVPVKHHNHLKISKRF